MISQGENLSWTQLSLKTKQHETLRVKTLHRLHRSCRGTDSERRRSAATYPDLIGGDRLFGFLFLEISENKSCETTVRKLFMQIRINFHVSIVVVSQVCLLPRASLEECVRPQQLPPVSPLIGSSLQTNIKWSHQRQSPFVSNIQNHSFASESLKSCSFFTLNNTFNVLSAS